MSMFNADMNPTLNAVIAVYLEAVDAGQTPDREGLLAAHSELADELREFFADHDHMNAAAAPVRRDGPETEAKASATAETFPQTFGDYELLEEIGKGGMGIVYKAKQVSLNRIVALKRIRAGQLASAEDIARFQREAKAAAGLDHPHIVPIYEVGAHQGQQYFTMKLIEGGNLNAHLSKYADDAKATAQVMIQIARAVHHAHQRGILHRDLKPGNILIDAEGNPHVSDFGLAQPIEREAKLTQSGAIVGTPEYMAPEQAKGEKGLTTAADVYGLGAIFYVLLTGQPPFQGDYNWETLKKVVEEEPVSPRSLRRKTNRDLEAVCLHCLHKEPTKRYATAQELANDLQRWLDGKPVIPKPQTFIRRLWKLARRRPAWTGFGITGFLLVLTLAVGGPIVALREAILREDAEDARNKLGEQVVIAHLSAEKAKAEARRAEDARHAILIKLGIQAWEQQEYDRLANILNEMRPEHRGAWETRHLRGLWRRDAFPIRSFKVHTGGVSCLAWSRDGKWILSGGTDSMARIWDAETGEVKTVFQPEDLKKGWWAHMKQVEWSPCGAQVMTMGGESNTVRMWDIRTGQEKVLDSSFWKNSQKGERVAWSPDGKWLAMNSMDFGAPDSYSVRVWSAATLEEKVVLKGATGYIQDLAWNPSGNQILAGCGDNTALIWDVETGMVKSTFMGYEDEIERGFKRNGISRVSWSPDGKKIITGGSDGTARRWDPETSKQKLRFSADHASVSCIAWSPDGTRVLVAGGRDGHGEFTAHVWNAESGAHITVLPNVSDAAFSPDGARIMTGNRSHETRIWNALTGQPLMKLKGDLLKHTGSRFGAWNPEGTLVATGGWDGSVDIWKPIHGQETELLQGHLERVTWVGWSRDSRRALTASEDGTGRIWNGITGREIALTKGSKFETYRVLWNTEGTRVLLLGGDNKASIRSGDAENELIGHKDRMMAMAWSPEGDRLLTACSDGTTWIWNGENGLPIVHFKNPGQEFLRAVAWSPDGLRVVVAGQAQVSIWDAQTGRELATLSGHKHSVAEVYWSPDGRRIVTWDVGGETRIWDGTTGELMGILRGHECGLGFLAWSPDHTRFLTAGRWKDQSARIWDAETGSELGVLKGANGLINTVAWSPDGSRVVTGGEDGIARVWDPVTCEEKAVLKGHARGKNNPAVREEYGGITSVAWSPDGRRILTGGSDGTARIWDAPPKDEH